MPLQYFIVLVAAIHLLNLFKSLAEGLDANECGCKSRVMNDGTSKFCLKYILEASVPLLCLVCINNGTGIPNMHIQSCVLEYMIF